MDTTMNIRIDILGKITRAANKLCMSRSLVIALLIKKVADEIIIPDGIGLKVQYQKRRQPGEWLIVHVQLREDAYEYCLDLRKLRKMSVSFILAYAVKKYLKELIGKLDTDNYRFTSYVIIKEVINSVNIWKFVWGIPPNL